MTKLKDIEFQNFDVVIFKNRKDRAIYLMGEFYFSDNWYWTEEKDIKNPNVYQVKQIFRNQQINGTYALRFLTSTKTESLDMKSIYINTDENVCPNCGKPLEE